MNNLLSFLQRLYKNGKRYNEVILRFVIKKLSTIKNFSERAVNEALEKCRELAGSSKDSVHNYISDRIACSCKQLIARIMNYKVVVKCRQGIVHFISKVNPIALFRSGKSAISTGLVMLVSILLLLVLTEGENIDFAFAADNETVNNYSEMEISDKKELDISCIVVDEEAALKLQEINEGKFYEVILQENPQEEVVTADVAANQTYAAPAVEQSEVATGETNTEQVDSVSIVVGEDTIEPVNEVTNTKEVAGVDDSIEDIDNTNSKIDTKYSLTDEELILLERIIEAEAGGEDIEGKILVANVVLNRVDSEEFPTTIKGVIMQKKRGKAQFSPVSNGMIWSVNVSQESKDAAKRALEGEDYSEGALYFMARKYSNPKNVKWFDDNLERLFQHGCHEFFK